MANDSCACAAQPPTSPRNWNGRTATLPPSRSTICSSITSSTRRSPPCPQSCGADEVLLPHAAAEGPAEAVLLPAPDTPDNASQDREGAIRELSAVAKVLERWVEYWPPDLFLADDGIENVNDWTEWCPRCMIRPLRRHGQHVFFSGWAAGRTYWSEPSVYAWTRGGALPPVDSRKKEACTASRVLPKINYDLFSTHVSTPSVASLSCP